MPRRRISGGPCAPAVLAEIAVRPASCGVGESRRHALERRGRPPRVRRGGHRFWGFPRSGPTRSAIAVLVTMLGGCQGKYIFVAPPRPLDGPFDSTINAYDHEVRGLSAVDPRSARIAVGRALTRLADALDAMPDARAGDLTSLAADTVRAGGQRLAAEGEERAPRTPDVKSSLVVVAAVMQRLADLVYADTPRILASARDLALCVDAIDVGQSIEAQRVNIQSAFDAADVTLGLIEAAAAESPFPPRERPRRASN